MERSVEESALLTPERLEVLSNWAASVRAACDALHGVPACGTTTIVISGRLDGAPGEASVLRGLSSELAERYGLEAAFELEGGGFTVRFRRAAA